jgi:hypothetical protein
MRPFDMKFGTLDKSYLNLPGTKPIVSESVDFVKELDANLTTIREISLNFQTDLNDKRTALSTTIKQNLFQPGDFILWRYNPENPLPSKLTSPFRGPFEVISQFKNDITCRHLVSGEISIFHVERVKLFAGNRTEAYATALHDNDQFVISHMAAYRGDPEVRTTMEFLVHFVDGSSLWKPWNIELFHTIPYEDFIRLHSELFPLLFTVAEFRRQKTAINRLPITLVQPGQTAFVNLRCYGQTWFQRLQLPFSDSMSYVVMYSYLRWASPTNMRKIWAECDVFEEEWSLDNLFIIMYGSTLAFNNANMILVDKAFVTLHPSVAPTDRHL